MNSLQQHIKQFIQPFKDETLFVACSGGIDSMVLLDLLSTVHLQIHVLHVNYHLRGEDSNQDQQLIENECNKRNIPFTVLEIDLKSELNTNNGNLQDKARKVRYDFFEKQLSEKPSKIVVAHHQDDQIETFFINISRKSGIMGLSAMLPFHNNILRPLLSISRADINQYALVKGINWREDRSNLENTYQRNKWRNVFLPFIEKENSAIKESVLLLIEKFQKTQVILEKKVADLNLQISETGVLNYLDFDKLSDEELFELLRQLNLGTTGNLSELKKLRISEKGKKLTLQQNNFIEIICEDSYFFFKKVEFNTLPTLKLKSISELPSTFNKESIFLNKTKLKGNLVLRYWKSGDRIDPIGINGSKLISDVITDAKVPHHQRNHQLVLCDDATIHWCVGLCIGKNAIAKFGDDIIHVELTKTT
jgi:tRNA(Ile)-lysidine synthase